MPLNVMLSRVGKRVAMLRIATNQMIQNDLADKIGCDPRTIQRIEAGEETCFGTLDKIAKIFNMDVQFLITAEDAAFNKFFRQYKKQFVKVSNPK